MKHALAMVSLVVRDYDEALAFYVGILGFKLVEDSEVPEQKKRWVVVTPPGSDARLLLARAVGAEQESRIGNQTGGRVFLFLYTDDFQRDYQRYKASGVTFVREPTDAPYGTVAVFRDLYGNLWDLIQPRPGTEPKPGSDHVFRSESTSRKTWSDPGFGVPGSRNVEIKARVPDLAAVEKRAKVLATEGPTDLVQDDTFFTCANGRLKLRQFPGGEGQLIHYQRPDEEGPKTSAYVISPTESPDTLREALARAYGTAGRVRKKRRLYIADRTRIHLDEVERLGSFVELEVVLRPDESAEAGDAVARSLMASLGIEESQLVSTAYVDLAA